MHQKHPTKPTMADKILTLLSDGEIHGCNELIQFGLSYRNRIGELRDRGYNIATIKKPKIVTAFYQLIK